MSCQPRPQPQANGIAAARASIGTPTNRPTRKRWTIVLCSSSMSGRAGIVLVPLVPLVPFVPRASGVGDIVLLEVWRRAEALYAYVTVAYDTVGCTRP